MKTFSKIKVGITAVAIVVLHLAEIKAQTTNNNEANSSNIKQTVNNEANGSNSYRTAIGIRVGETSGLTVKHFFGGSNAVEGILGIWPYAFGITGLYEHYVSTGLRGLSCYFGLGGHFNTIGSGLVYYPYYYYHDRYYLYRYNYPGMGIGVDGIIGAEYKIPKIPFAISFDIKPLIEINNASRSIYTSLDPGLGIKFTF
jgi:hypothetical protein